MKKYLLISTLLSTAFLAGCGSNGVQPKQQPTDQLPQAVACTMEAKACPDGSYVGRTGPNCEFTACPTTGTQVACTEEAKLCPDGSSVARTGPKCEFAPCPTTGTQWICNHDGKLCPDGSTVGRTGPNCEFAACPISGEETACGITPDASCGTDAGK